MPFRPLRVATMHVLGGGRDTVPRRDADVDSSQLPRRWLQASNPWYYFTLCLVSALSSVSMSAPTTRSKPDWINPCGIEGHVFDPKTDMSDAPNIPLEELFTNVIRRATSSKSYAVDRKKQFLENTFHDPDFESSTSMFRQDWLPAIPPTNDEHFKEISKEEAFQRTFEYLQYFAVGIEQTVLDQTLHSGQFSSMFQNTQNDLTQILCELQVGMYTLGIQPNSDVMRDVMSQDYRDISATSRRNLRDYLIIRDYIHAVDYVAELFGYLKRTLK